MSLQGPGSNGNQPPRPDRPPRLDGYELLGEVGRGGSGVVYKARQRGSGRLVAIKVAHRELLDEGRDERARKARDRYEAQSQALMALEHEGLVPVLEVGRCDGRPYCVMPFVEGRSLAEVLHDGPLPNRRAASCIEAAARAVHYAHMHGLVHRDLKPRNILIAEDRPLVTDFGLNGWLGDAILGTPSYLAPEQARGAVVVDTGADVYALGATLYHALTGRPPFQSADALETLRQVRAVDPLPPRRLNPAVDQELEVICLKCLEKDPCRRYDSAADLADDLRRYREGEPLRARGPGLLARLGRSIRQRPAAAALTFLLVFLLLVSGALTLLVVSRVRLERLRSGRPLALALEEEQARAAVEAEARAREALELERRRQDRAGPPLAALTLRLADAEWQAGRPERARALLEEVQAPLRQWEWRFLKRRFAGGQVTLYGHVGRVAAVAFSPDGTRLASAGGDGMLRVWEVATGAELFARRGRAARPDAPAGLSAVAYSPDGRRLATTGADETLRLWDAGTGAELATLPGKAVAAVAYSPDGKLLATAGPDGTVRLRNPADGAELRALRGHDGSVLALAFGPDGRLASAGADRTVRVWDTAGGKELFALKGHSAAIHAVAFSPDGKRLASAGADRVVRLWDAVAGGKSSALEGHTAAVSAVAFSPDGMRLASAGADHTIRLWDAHSGAALLTLRGHEGAVNHVAFNPDGRRLASAGADGALKLWDARGEEALVLAGQAGGLTGLAFARTGRLAAAGRDGTVLLWGTPGRAEALRLRGHDGPVQAVALSADGRLLASGGSDESVRIWDAATGRQVSLFRGHTGPVNAVAFGPGPNPLLFSAGADRTVRVWESAGGEQRRPLRDHIDAVHALAIRPDGTQLASGGAAGTLKVWGGNTDRVFLNLAGHVGRVTALAYSPNGQRLASAGADETVRVWSADNGQELLVLRGHTGAVTSVAFSPDGLRLVSGGEDGAVRVWDAQTGDEVLALAGHAGGVTSVAFSGDGRRLAAAGQDGAVRLWDGRESPSVSVFRGHLLAVQCVAFSPDGLRLASGGGDRTARIWDVLTGASLLTLSGARGAVTELAFPADGQQLLGRDDTGAAVGWDVSTGRHLPAPRPPRSAPGAAAVSPDGRRLAFAGPGSIVRVIERTTPDLEELAARAAVARPDPAWHEAEAGRAARAGRWFPAAFHLDRLLAGRPRDAALLLERGRARAGLGRKDEARADFAAAVPGLLVPWPGH
jgi:WD40 repeat protein/tRNA A-37 threonylcarbamoyl transferase component Bud32